MFQSTRLLVVVTVLSIMALFSTSRAEIPQYINYQGKITDSGGTPVPDGNYTMRFRIYDAATGGNLYWDSGSRTVSVSDGIVNILLGESPQPALSLLFEEDLWLLVTFQGTNQTPRVRLTSTSYSYMSSGLVAGTDVRGSLSGTEAAALRGTNTSTTGTSYGVIGSSDSSDGCGVYGRAEAGSGFNKGVMGYTISTDGVGVFGTATQTTGSTTGVSGSSSSTSGRGVFGLAEAFSGTNYGVMGETRSTDGVGVIGLHFGYGITDLESWARPGGFFGGSIGVVGISKNVGKGVMGWHKHSTTTGDGVFGRSDSNQGVGVTGLATSTTGTCYGGNFQTSSSSGYAVAAQATATTGVTYGVWGYAASPSGYAGYFQGNSRVTGNLTVDGTLSASGLGDITAVNAGTGLDGGGSSGAVTLNVEVPLHLSASNSEPIVQGVNTMTSGTAPGVKGMTNSATGRGVSGWATETTGQNYGVYGGSASTSGVGVRGYVNASTGACYGGSFTSSSNSGFGVYAYASSSTGPTSGIYGVSQSTAGWGVYGNATATTGTTYGVEGYNSSSSGGGVRGNAASNAGTTYGGHFTTSSPAGRGVYGRALQTTGANYGGYFESNSTSGTGVYGVVAMSTYADRYGVYGYCFPTENWGIGVRGEGGYRGVHGISVHTSVGHTTYGVYGEASGGSLNYGVYASGDLGASGTKSAIVRTNEGPKAVYCQESTEVWFEDFGTGVIQEGLATVGLAADFLQTVTIDDQNPFKVFLTPKADIGRWWVEDTGKAFRLHAPDAPDGAIFDYRVVAKRAGYENLRLAPVASGYSDHFLYPDIGDVPARHQAEWLKAEAVRQETAHDPAADR